MREDEDDVSIDRACVLRETLKAVFVEIVDENGEYRRTWIPKSVITDDSDVHSLDDEGTLVVKAWFARKEGLE